MSKTASELLQDYFKNPEYAPKILDAGHLTFVHIASGKEIPFRFHVVGEITQLTYAEISQMAARGWEHG